MNTWVLVELYGMTEWVKVDLLDSNWKYKLECEEYIIVNS